ncbi:MAG TPA: iron-containing alcohol dehydrogenase [Anaerolineae bacterium]|nr:iron-containing alcohol dehydrogenase [Anaerolineae bacterium]
MNEFHYIGYAQEVIFGAGSLAQLSAAVDRFHWRRLMLCASNSARHSGHVSSIEAALGDRLVAIYDHVQPHVPDFQVAEATALAAERQVDAVIGLGGGSPIGMAKAVSQTLEEKRTRHPARASFPTDQPLVPVVAIPTTYAGSEMTAVYGVTHHADGSARKITVTDPKITPKLVIYDPQLTLDLPPELTASSGINALAHCVEAAYSITRHPLSTAAALSGAQHIVHALPRCHSNGDDVEARTAMLIGSHLAAVSLCNVTMGLHHGLCHALGGTAGVPHGIANAIVLPHAMRFNVDATAPQLAQLAEAIGLSINDRGAEAAAEAAAQRIADLIGQMNLPQRLRDVGVGKTDLPQLAQVALQSRAVQSNPKPIRDAAQIEALLEAMW